MGVKHPIQHPHSASGFASPYPSAVPEGKMRASPHPSLAAIHSNQVASAVYLLSNKTAPPYLLPGVRLPPQELSMHDWPVESREASAMWFERQQQQLRPQHGGHPQHQQRINQPE